MIVLHDLHFFCFLSFIFLAYYVFIKDPKSLLNRTFSVLMLCFSLWNFGDIILHDSTRTISKGMVIMMQNISSIGWVSFASVILYFALIFSKKKKLFNNKWVLFFILFLPLLFFYKQLTNNLTINPTRRTFGWSVEWADTIWVYLFYIYNFTFIVAAILMIYLHGRKTKNKNERYQANIFTIVTLCGFVVGSVFDIVIQNSEILNIPPVANLVVFIFEPGAIYAITKYRFLSITPTVAAEDIIQSMDEILILLEQEGNIVSVNNSAIESLQYEQKELEGNPLSMLNKEDSFNSNSFGKFISETAILNQESNLLAKNGIIIPIIYSLIPVKDKTGIIIGIIFLARDITKLKQADEELRESKDRLQNIFNNLQDAYFEADLNGYLTTVSPSIKMIYGYESIDELKGEHAANLYANPEEREKLLNLLKEKKSIVDFRCEGKRKNGTAFWVSINAQFQYDSSGQVIGTIGVVRDITDRKMAEGALLKSEANYRNIFDNAIEGMYRTSISGKALMANPALISMLGYNSIDEYLREMNDSANMVWYVPEQRSAYLSLLEKQDIITGYECQLKRKDGTPIWVSLNAKLIRDDNGNTMYSEGFIEDITIRKKSKDALKASEEKFRNLAESALVAISIIPEDYESGYLYVNNYWQKLTGYSKNESEQMKALDLVHPDFREMVAQKSRQRIKGEEVPSNYEIKLLSKSGKTIWVKFAATLINYEGKQANLTTSIDITERKEMEGALVFSKEKAEQNENLLNIAGEIARLGGWSINLKSDILTWTKEVYNIHEIDLDFVPTVEKAIGFYDEKSLPIIQSAISEAIANGKTFDVELVIISAKGNQKNIRTQGKAIKDIDGNIEYVYGIIQDITSRIYIEDELIKLNKQLQELYLRQSEVLENERKAISREIHDELGQLLSALMIDLDWTLDNIEDKTAAKERMNEMSDIVNRTIQTVQKISSNLRPDLLDDLGLIPALEWYTEEFEKRTGIKCLFKSDGFQITDEKINLVLYRILQESLTNVSRHARAKNLSVNLVQTNDLLTLEVRDDGQGFDLKKLDSRESLGFIGIRERLKPFNGNLEITSVKNTGTTLNIKIPIN